MTTSCFDCVVLGGGVIGLALARELARRAVRVAVVERGQVGREASWAGAGILPPASEQAALHPYDQLRAMAFRLHPVWAEELFEETGIDIQYRRCGGLYLAETPGEAAALLGLAEQWHEEGIMIERWDRNALAEHEPALLAAWDHGRLRAVYHVPDEAQVRNPRLLQALAASCRRRGVQILEQAGEGQWHIDGSRIRAWCCAHGAIRADTFCVAAGAWSYPLLRQLGVATGILPIRGQIVVFMLEQPPLRHIWNEGSRYLVARQDGLLLVGSTEEEVGYCKEITTEAVEQLTQFARRLLPAIAQLPVARAWAGLRPGSFDGWPYLGQATPWENLYVCAGHFRSGLYLAPATAQVMADLLTGGIPRIDLAPFSLNRAACRPGRTTLAGLGHVEH